MDCSMPGFPVHHYLPEFAQTQIHWVDDAIQPSHPSSPASPPALNLSQHQGLFQWVGSLHQVVKYWSFSFSIRPSNEYSGLISFRIDWFDFLAVQGTLKSLLQHHNLKALVLLHSAFFMVHLSHLYMTTGKTIALTVWTFVGKVMSQLFNIPSRLIIACLLRSRWLLISWLHSLSAVILEPKRIKSATVSSFSPSICHEVMGPDAMILVFWMLNLKPYGVVRISFDLSSEKELERNTTWSQITEFLMSEEPVLSLLPPTFPLLCLCGFPWSSHWDRVKGVKSLQGSDACEREGVEVGWAGGSQQTLMETPWSLTAGGALGFRMPSRGILC